jgi:hypothetical protein
MNDFIYTGIHPESKQEIELITTADLIAVLREKYPKAVEDESDFIIEYIFENRELGL